MNFLNFSEVFSPIQLLAWAAALVYFISYQRQSSSKTIILWAPADILMALHFYFMNAPLFMLTALGGTIRSLMAIYAPRKALGIYLVLYILALIAVFPFIGDGLKDYIAVAGTTFFCFSVWFKENFLAHRFFAFMHQISWIIAFILLGSYGGLALISVMFFSNIIGTGRYILKQRS